MPCDEWQGKKIATKCPHLYEAEFKKKKSLDKEKQKKYQKELGKFEKERAFLLQLQTMGQHPNIVFIYGYVYPPKKGQGIEFLGTKRPGLVMECVNGGSLESALHKKGMNDDQKFDIVCGLAKGIEFLHEQVPVIVHKDLKPDNLMVHKDVRSFSLFYEKFFDTFDILYTFDTYFCVSYRVFFSVQYFRPMEST